jgi:cytochrome oxidase Cu insertion factor (SCO1/SenC/PrrC family)
MDEVLYFHAGGNVMRSLPRRLTLVVIGAALTGCLASSTHTTNKLSNTDKPARDISGSDADGTPFHLSDYRGKVVLLDFWASW